MLQDIFGPNFNPFLLYLVGIPTLLIVLAIRANGRRRP